MRSVFRRKSTREVADPAFLDLAFPYYWRYDVLCALDGGWLLDRIHSGRVNFELEGGVGAPSRWNTLRALQVLDWWDRGALSAT